MGGMKQIDVQMQETIALAVERGDKELADTVAWYRAHYEKLPPELMRAILTDNEFFEKALIAWWNEVPAPKPASSHVALQEELPSRRALREKRGFPWRCVIGWSMIAGAILAGLIVIGVNL